MEETTLKTLIENVYDDLTLLKVLCNNYIVYADFVRALDISDETDEIKRAFDKALIKILTVADSIRTKYQLY